LVRIVNPRRHIITALIAAAFVLGLSSSSPAVEYRWEFSDFRARAGWVGENIRFLFVRDDSLVIKGSGIPRLISPFGVNIPSSSNMVWLRLKTPHRGPGTILLGSAAGKREYVKVFTLKGGVDYRDYRVYIGGAFPAGGVIERFALVFPAISPTDEISVDFIRFYDPTPVEYISIWWGGFWEPDEIDGSTINSVTTPFVGPLSFMTVLYFLVAVVSVAVVLRSYSKGAFRLESALRAVIVSFVVAGVAFTVRMDYNWLKVWQDDFTTLGGREVTERVPLVFEGFADFFEFMDFLRDTVPRGGSLRPAAKPPHDIFAALARYYLFPVDTSESAEYLWVYHDADVSYDEADGTLKRGDKTLAAQVSLVSTFGGGRGAVYRIIKEDEG
jgi:hypothetical protein